MIEELESRKLFSVAHPAPGSLDPGFGHHGVVAGSFGTAPILQPDGKILFGPSAAFMDRYLPDGSPDPSFGIGGTVSLPTFGSLRTDFWQAAVQRDGKIVLAGIGSADRLILSRLNGDGSLDETFGTSGLVEDDSVSASTTSALRIESDDKIIVVIGGTVVRLNPDGSTDATFGTDGHVTLSSFSPSDLLIQPDGHLLLPGLAAIYDANGEPHTLELSELNPDGSPDASFGTAGVVLLDHSDTPTPHVVVTPSGKIIMATVPFAGRPTRITLRQLNADGSEDSSFAHKGTLSIRMGSFGWIDSCAIATTANGKVFVAAGGHVGTLNYASPVERGVPQRFGAIALTSNGKIDHLFGHDGRITRSVGSAFGGADVFSVIQPDQKLLVDCGSFFGRFLTS